MQLSLNVSNIAFLCSLNSTVSRCTFVTHQAQEDIRSLDERQTIAREYLQSVRLKTVDLDDSFIVNMDETQVYIDTA